MTDSLRATFPHREFGACEEVLLSFWDEQLDRRSKAFTRRRGIIKLHSRRPMLVFDAEDSSPFARHQRADAPSILRR